MRKNPLIRAEGVALLSVNVSWKNGCLQAEPFMFASSYIYQHLSLESFDKAYQDAVQTRLSVFTINATAGFDFSIA